MHTFTVNRKNWYRGKNFAELRNGKGQKCCLGFLANSCDLSSQKLTGMGDLEDLFSLHSHTWNMLVEEKEKAVKRVNNIKEITKDTPIMKLMCKDLTSNRLCRDIIKINDNPKLTDEKREKLLTKKFKRIDVEVNFID